MRWLMFAFIVSVVALVAASAGMAHHILRQRGQRSELGMPAGPAEEPETEEAP